MLRLVYSNETGIIPQPEGEEMITIPKSRLMAILTAMDEQETARYKIGLTIGNLVEALSATIDAQYFDNPLYNTGLPEPIIGIAKLLPKKDQDAFFKAQEKYYGGE